MLIQKDAEEGGFIKKFYIKYNTKRSRRKYLCYNDCKPIETNIQASDSRSKVYSFALDTFETRGGIELFAIGEDGKHAVGRFDLVIEPTIKIPPHIFPVVVSMYKDRSD